MNVTPLAISDVLLITTVKHGDDRGFFSETWNRRLFAEAGIAADFVQDNQAFSQAAGVVRGLHFQLPPAAQDKLVRVVQGEILDVAVDLRRSSPTFGRHVTAVLSAENRAQLWVPKGFAHGYVTRRPRTEVGYKVTGYYAAELERGLLWNDPALGIEWGIEAGAAILSAKDRDQPRLCELAAAF